MKTCQSGLLIRWFLGLVLALGSELLGGFLDWFLSRVLGTSTYWPGSYVVGIPETLSRDLACALARGLPLYIVFSSPLLLPSTHLLFFSALALV